MESDEYEEAGPEGIDAWEALCRNWKEVTGREPVALEREQYRPSLAVRWHLSWALTGLVYLGRCVLAAIILVGGMARLVVFYALALVRPLVNTVCGGGAVLCLLAAAIMYFVAEPRQWLGAVGFAGGFIVLNMLYDVLLGVIGIGLDTSGHDNT